MNPSRCIIVRWTIYPILYCNPTAALLSGSFTSCFVSERLLFSGIRFGESVVRTPKMNPKTNLSTTLRGPPHRISRITIANSSSEADIRKLYCCPFSQIPPFYNWPIRTVYLWGDIRCNSARKWYNISYERLQRPLKPWEWCMSHSSSGP